MKLQQHPKKIFTIWLKLLKLAKKSILVCQNCSDKDVIKQLNKNNLNQVEQEYCIHCQAAEVVLPKEETEAIEKGRDHVHVIYNTEKEMLAVSYPGEGSPGLMRKVLKMGKS